MINKPKAVILAEGVERGCRWRIYCAIGYRTKNFTGAFVVKDGKDKEKDRIRRHDRYFFQRRLGSSLGKYEVNHDWGAWEQTGIAWVTLLTPKEHRNTLLGKSNQRRWIEEEDWIEEIEGARKSCQTK